METNCPDWIFFAQALMLSLLPEDVTSALKGDKAALKGTSLKAISDWFQENTRLEEANKDDNMPDPKVLSKPILHHFKYLWYNENHTFLSAC